MKNVLRITLPRVIESEPILVNLYGHLTGEAATEVKEKLEDVLSVYPQDCTINVSNGIEIDLGGLNSLIKLQKIQSDKGNKLSIISKIDSPICKYIRLSGMNNYIDLKHA